MKVSNNPRIRLTIQRPGNAQIIAVHEGLLSQILEDHVDPADHQAVRVAIFDTLFTVCYDAAQDVTWQIERIS